MKMKALLTHLSAGALLCMASFWITSGAIAASDDPLTGFKSDGTGDGIRTVKVECSGSGNQKVELMSNERAVEVSSDRCLCLEDTGRNDYLEIEARLKNLINEWEEAADSDDHPFSGLPNSVPDWNKGISYVGRFRNVLYEVIRLRDYKDDVIKRGVKPDDTVTIGLYCYPTDVVNKINEWGSMLTGVDVSDLKM